MALKDELIAKAKDASSYLVIKKILQKVFCRYERKDDRFIPGLININRCNLKRKEFFINSNTNKISAYYYDNNSNKLIVFCHGLKSSSDDYIPFINYFYNNGFDIISFNSTGTCESEGEYIFGMSQLLIDLDNVINYIDNDNILSKKDIYLFGHSWGGYSVCSVLNIHKNIKKVVSISGFNDAASILVDIGMYYGGNIAGLPKKYIDRYQEELFGKYLDYKAIDGINNSSASVFLAHGKSDMIIKFNVHSIVSKIDMITNENIKIYIGRDYNAGHTNILYSKEAIDYQKEVDKKIKDFDDESEELIKYIETVDHYKYSEINGELFSKILDFYNK